MANKHPRDYLPHSDPMVLLDEVIEIAETSVTCRVTTSKSGVFAPYIKQNALSAVYLIEIMAQTIGVWAGDRRERFADQFESALANIGLLLSVRSWSCHVDSIPLDQTLTITMHQTMNDAQLAVFEGDIKLDDGSTIASGRLTVYQPTVEESKALFERPL